MIQVVQENNMLFERNLVHLELKPDIEQEKQISTMNSSRRAQRRLRTEIHPQAMNHQLQLLILPADTVEDIADILIEYGNNPLKIPAFNYAVYLGKGNIVQQLLQYGANINQASNIGTPLEIALECQNFTLARFLIDRSATATIKAASICCKNHSITELELLLKMNPEEILQSESIILDCCESSFLDGLEFLFKNGATLPKSFAEQKILYKLLSTSDPKYLPVIKFMINQGAECHYTQTESRIINNGRNQWTACCIFGLLIPALEFDDEDLIALLIQHGAYLNSEIKILEPNCHRWFSDNSQREQVMCLNPLYKAMFSGKFDIVNSLIAAGAKRDAWLDIEYNSVEFIISHNKVPQMDDYFKKIKKAVELGFLTQTNYFWSMMLWAIKEKNDVNWVEFLFRLGAEPKDVYLKFATEMKNKDIIKFLIEHGAKP